MHSDDWEYRAIKYGNHKYDKYNGDGTKDIGHIYKGSCNGRLVT